MGKEKCGRKQLNISPSQIEKLASYGLTNSELADYFNCSESSMEHKFATFITKGKSNLRMRLRKKQINVALSEKGNVVMLIWLGKQYLGQSDKLESASGLNDGEIERLKQISKQEFEDRL